MYESTETTETVELEIYAHVRLHSAHEGPRIKRSHGLTDSELLFGLLELPRNPPPAALSQRNRRVTHATLALPPTRLDHSDACSSSGRRAVRTETCERRPEYSENPGPENQGLRAPARPGKSCRATLEQAGGARVQGWEHGPGMPTDVPMQVRCASLQALGRPELERAGWSIPTQARAVLEAYSGPRVMSHLCVRMLTR